MKNRTIALAIILGLSLAIVVPFAIPRIVMAQDCTDPTGRPIPCPPEPVQPEEEEEEERPTEISYPSFTPTALPTSTPLPTATPTPVETATPVASETPTAVLVAVPTTPGGGGPLGGIFGGFGWLFGMIIIVCFGGGLLLLRRVLMGDGSVRERESPTKFGGGDEQGFIVEDGKPNGSQPLAEYEEIAEYEEVAHDGLDEGSVFEKQDPFPDMQPGEDGFVKFDSSQLPEPHMQTGEEGFAKMGPSPHMKPGEDGFAKMGPQPHMQPGEDGFAKMGPQPHMQPGEANPPEGDKGFDTDMKPGEVAPPEGDKGFDTDMKPAELPPIDPDLPASQ